MRFGFGHFQTDGKLENTLEALGEIDAEEVCLAPISAELDGISLDAVELEKRLVRTEKVVGKLRRKKIAVDISLPGFWADASLAGDGGYNLRALAKRVLGWKVRGVYLDDSASWSESQYFDSDEVRGKVLSLAKSLGKIFGKSGKAGLIAAAGGSYEWFGLDVAQLAGELAGGGKVVVLQSQQYSEDYGRAAILGACYDAQETSARKAVWPKIGWGAFIDQAGGSPFHKSAETTQMQITLSLLCGQERVMIDAADLTGTAMGDENPYLKIIQKRRKLWGKLAGFKGQDYRFEGVRVVGGSESAAGWVSLLERLGTTVRVVMPEDVGKSEGDGPYVLSGDLPARLSLAQLKHVLGMGVLMDGRAAEVIGRMGHAGLIGVEVAGALDDVQSEILSDQSFGTFYYGHRCVFAAPEFNKLVSIHERAKTITSLLCRGKLPNQLGMMIYESEKGRQRCAVVPYSFRQQAPRGLLTLERQRHLIDVLQWLGRCRLGYVVENTPDLVPLAVRVNGRKRIILMLVNVGFDWAIDARIRLGHLPFTIKKVRELGEDGKVDIPDGLGVSMAGDYCYLELTPDTAVPPLQTTVLLLEG